MTYKAPIRRSPVTSIWLWVATISFTIAGYWPGLSGDFLFDDSPH